MKKYYLGATLILTSISSTLLGRSPFRPPEIPIPEIITNWEGETETYHLKNNYIEETEVFHTFDHQYLKKHLLPTGKIPYRNYPEKNISGELLTELTDHLIKELKEGNTRYTDFIMLKNSDFNPHTLSGGIILKFKKYPFVLKLFLETPQTFSSPFSKGWQPTFIFMMSGGLNRFLLGFNRIKNLEQTKEKINNSPEWAGRVDLPRKWFVIPPSARWFEVRSKNLPHDNFIRLPSAYGIIADAISADKKFTLFNKKNRELTMSLCRFLETSIDPHIDNFLKEKETGKLVIIDTEPFLNLVGIKKPMLFENYFSWYTQIAFKCIRDLFGRDKKSRLQLCKRVNPA
jgi:hypothetical protein